MHQRKDTKMIIGDINLQKNPLQVNQKIIYENSTSPLHNTISNTGSVQRHSILTIANLDVQKKPIYTFNQKSYSRFSNNSFKFNNFVSKNSGIIKYQQGLNLDDKM